MLQLWAALVFVLAVRSFAGALLPPPIEVRIEPWTVDVNSASVSELQALPGVGATRAAAIVLERLRAGPFGAIDQLQRVDGIGPEVCAQLRPFATCGDAAGAQ